LKKLVLKGEDVNLKNIENFVFYKDVSFSNNYLYEKPLENKDFKLLNQQNFDFFINANPKIKKVLYVQSTDNLRNRDSFEKISNLTKSVPNVQFYYMNGTKDNKEFLEKRFGKDFSIFPQLLILNESETVVIPPVKFLKYSLEQFTFSTLFSEKKKLNI
jgi:hypothetical protein